ncbi:MAG: type II CRISPR-associated endonuclease Cas1 [Candidatus Brocadiia bacterium]
MTEHILDISERDGRLRVRHEQLILESDEEVALSLPLEEIAAVVVSNRRVTYSQPVLAGIAGHGGMLVVCDEKHLPVAMLMPLNTHFVQSERLRMQANVNKPTCKRLWQQLVRTKLRAQGALLQRLHGEDHGLAAMAKRVRSGDPENLEGQAAQRYWPALFGDPQFRRARDADDLNRHLNYGYAVLRALVARAICGVGLQPGLGIHHHNRYDAFCLADDVMEPFRTLVDSAVVNICRERGEEAPLDREAKASLLSPMQGRLLLNGERRTLFDVLARCASSLVKVFEGRRKRLALPKPEELAGTPVEEPPDSG